MRRIQKSPTHPQYTLEKESKTEGDSTRGRDISERAKKVQAGRSTSRNGNECSVANGGHGAYSASNIVNTARNIGTKQKEQDNERTGIVDVRDPDDARIVVLQQEDAMISLMIVTSAGSLMCSTLSSLTVARFSRRALAWTTTSAMLSLLWTTVSKRSSRRNMSATVSCPQFFAAATKRSRLTPATEPTQRNHEWSSATRGF